MQQPRSPPSEPATRPPSPRVQTLSPVPDSNACTTPRICPRSRHPAGRTQFVSTTLIRRLSLDYSTPASRRAVVMRRVKNASETNCSGLAQDDVETKPEGQPVEVRVLGRDGEVLTLADAVRSGGGARATSVGVTAAVDGGGSRPPARCRDCRHNDNMGASQGTAAVTQRGPAQGLPV